MAGEKFFFFCLLAFFSFDFKKAAQLVNFTLVPAKFAVLYVNNVGLIWNTYICWLNAREIDSPEKNEAVDFNIVLEGFLRSF